jgi:signal transduction histidine kinase
VNLAPHRKLAHELGNQLGIVISYAELLLEELDAEHPKRSAIDTIDRGSRQLLRLFDGVTTFEGLGEDVRKQYRTHLTVLTQACESVLTGVPTTDPVAADVREMLKAIQAVAAMGRSDRS